MPGLQRRPLPVPGAGGAASGPRARLSRLRAPGAVAVAIAGATCWLALVDPHTPGQYGVCPLLALTGLYCAGCGGLRATHDLAHGDLAGAWAMNPLLVLAVPLVAVLWARWAARRWRGAPVPPREQPRLWPAWSLLVVVVGYSVLRNVPALAPVLAP